MSWRSLLAASDRVSDFWFLTSILTIFCMITPREETESKKTANGWFLFCPPGTGTVGVRECAGNRFPPGNGLFSCKEQPARESTRRRIAIQGGQEPFPRKSPPLLVSP